MGVVGLDKGAVGAIVGNERYKRFYDPTRPTNKGKGPGYAQPSVNADPNKGDVNGYDPGGIDQTRSANAADRLRAIAKQKPQVR